MPRVIVTISVDWEGRHLRDENLDAMYHFRSSFPVPLSHYICPAYFTRGSNGNVDRCIAERIQSQVLPRDEVGVHIHCWTSLLLASDVQPLQGANAVNYHGTSGDPEIFWVPYGQNQIDTGHGVSLSAFSASDVGKLLDQSRSILRANNIISGEVDGFRAGGWMASDQVLQALVDRGFVYDTSATNYEFFRDSSNYNPDTPLYEWVAKIWGRTAQRDALLANAFTLKANPRGVTATTQPYRISVKDDKKLIEMPDTGVLADQVNENYILQLIQAAFQADPHSTVFVHIGFHQESADISYDTLKRQVRGKTGNLDKVTAVLMTLEEEGLFDKIQFLTTAEAARVFASTSS